MGISGQELSNRAFVQAEKFGAHIAIARSAKELKTSHPPYTIEQDDGGAALGRTVIIAAGSRYRRLDLPNLSSLKESESTTALPTSRPQSAATKRSRSKAVEIQQGRRRLSLPEVPSMFI